MELLDIGFRDGIYITGYVLLFGLITKLSMHVRDLHLWHRSAAENGGHTWDCQAIAVTECLDKLVEIEQQTQAITNNMSKELIRMHSVQNQVLRSLDEIMRRQWDDHRSGSKY